MAGTFENIRPDGSRAWEDTIITTPSRENNNLKTFSRDCFRRINYMFIEAINITNEVLFHSNLYHIVSFERINQLIILSTRDETIVTFQFSTAKEAIEAEINLANLLN